MALRLKHPPCLKGETQVILPIGEATVLIFQPAILPASGGHNIMLSNDRAIGIQDTLFSSKIFTINYKNISVT